jgi:hypothetical protein
MGWKKYECTRTSLPHFALFTLFDSVRFSGECSASGEFVRRERQTRLKGKRGGFRYLYLYFVRGEQIALLYLFDKNEKEDLTKADKKILAARAAEAGEANK